MKLYSAWYCPFAQRTWMSLLHKGVAFEYIETDPYDKTQQWLRLSRQTGMVPVLSPPKGGNLPGSTRSMEYLDDAYPVAPKLYANGAEEKSEQKFWVDFIGENITPYFYRFLKSQHSDNFENESKRSLISGLSSVVQSMSDGGPYFDGDGISAVDITLFPFAYRIRLLLGYYKSFELPKEGPIWQRYEQWYEAMLKTSIFRDSIDNPINYDERLIQFYLPYSLGGGQTDVTALSA